MKPGNKKGAVVLAGLLLVGAVVFGFRWQAGHALRSELERARLRNKTLSLELSANQPASEATLSSADLAKLESERQAAILLRREIDELREKQQAVARTAPPEESKGLPTDPELVRGITNSVLAPSEWKRAGAATPAATFETSLWAAANGEIETLAGLLLLEGDARAKAEAMLSKVSPEIHAQYASPERLIALFTAKDVPPGGAQIIESKSPPGTERRTLGVRLVSADGGSRITGFSLRLQGAEWKLVVPPKAVEKYEAMWSGPSGAGGN